MLVYENELIIKHMSPNFEALKGHKDIIVTAPSINKKYHFVSRLFAPSDAILEDPVTGSAHCTLAPYWGERLQKQKMIAYQASKRGGEIYLNITKDHLEISGEAIIVLSGVLNTIST